MRKLIPFLAIIAITSCHMIMPAQVELAGVIRRSDGNSWATIDDGGHTPIGILSINETDTIIRVNYDFIAGTIYSFSITVDETLASRGYMVGASVGLEYANIYIYRIIDGNIVLVNPQTIDEPKGNIWIYGLFGGL